MKQLHMVWHQYGPVELAVTGIEDPQCFARLRGGSIVYHQRATGKAEPNEFGHPEPAYGWFVWRAPALGHPEYRVNSRAPEDVSALFNAGAVLIWHEWAQFQGADRAMGDPNP